MKFLVISQRAIPRPTYNLKDLPGHGRFDVVLRCILAALRDIPGDQHRNEIFVFLKGEEPFGWLHLDQSQLDQPHDEVSLAAHIKRNWAAFYTVGSLDTLIRTSFSSDIIAMLHETGRPLSQVRSSSTDITALILGAQQDPTAEDLISMDIGEKISLTDEILLASHAIIYYRQLTSRD